MNPDDIFLLKLLLGTLLLVSLSVVPVLVVWGKRPILPSFLSEGGGPPKWEPPEDRYERIAPASMAVKNREIARLKQRVAELEAGR